jgi:AraC family transcriptional regulator
MTLPINPRSEQVGMENAILSGLGDRYHVPDFEGSLSIKSVIRGSACWETSGRRFVVDENTYLILNDRQHYTITIDSITKVRTFCLFFQRGFVEDIHWATITPENSLLDSPCASNAASIGFFNRLEPQDSGVPALLRAFHSALVSGEMSQDRWDQHFLRIGSEIVRERRETLRVVASLPAVKASTREEVYRRVLRGRDFLLASLQAPVRLKQIAAEACLSPYHFQRSFSLAFRETPHRYLARHRLETAARLLRSTKMSVTEIGLDVGFDSVASFSDAFRRYFGASPARYRRAI